MTDSASSNASLTEQLHNAGRLILASLPRGPRLPLLLGLGLLAALAEGGGLLLLGLLVNRLNIQGGNAAAGWTPDLGSLLLIYGVIVIFAALVVRQRNLVVQQHRQDYIKRLRQRIYEALIAMAWQPLNRLHGPDINQLLMQETGRVGIGTEFALSIIGLSLQIVMVGAVALNLSPLLAGITILLAALAMLAVLLAERQLHAAGTAQIFAHRLLNALVADALRGRRLIKSMALENQAASRFAAQAEAITSLQMQHVRQSSTHSAMIQIILGISAAVGLWLATQHFGLGLADALVLVLALGRLGQSVLGIRSALQMVLQAVPAQQTISRALQEADAAREPAAATDFAPPRRTIRCADVSLRYVEAGAAALHDVSVSLPVGSTTLLSGASGAGKSTLVDMLTGLAVPDSGAVLLDDKALDAASRRAWRRHVAYMPQDTFLFNESIRANLLLAAPDADDAKLWAALGDAGIADFVRRLPGGLDSPVGENGANLSGGERQRLTLARALLRNATLLVLDEPSSALDAASEQQLVHTLHALHGRCTMLIVSHRPALLPLADQHIELADGRLKASV
ncbi:ABC transporter ATP-binding protein [Ferrovibrio sp.]|uniref:ABC transporter ATP-binding protein n=1 Tax=Ferrovibrio sp. TaxID=1917215 RepID=UPI001B562EEB|nr:ABC transporter ATP-binding protein [Ferrovibrio sp.]MBP7063663.1 ABC transporter ATP-binding protein [Ferrovibrio sp.]